MWQQNYYFVGGSLAWSALISAAPLLTLFYLLGILRKPAWLSAVASLGVAVFVALLFVRMPLLQAAAATLNGAAFGLFPISWIVFSSILMYRLAVDTGRFEIIRDSIGALTSDRRLQLLLIGFAFNGFIEGAAGFGSPVAVSAAMLAGLGFPPFYAALLCLIGNTAPVAFGSIGIPIVTLTQITGLPMAALSAMTGRFLAIVALFVPVYMLVLMAGPAQTAAVWPAVIACAITFGAVQFLVSNFIGPELTAILASLASMSAIVLLMQFWKPRHIFRLEGEEKAQTLPARHGAAETLLAWTPYLLLVAFVLVWGYKPVKAWLDATTTITLPVPGLHNLIQRMPPVTAQPSPYAALFVFNWLSAAGTACVLAVMTAAAVLRVPPRQFASIYRATLHQLALPMVTIATVLALAFLMNYAGMTSTLGLAFAASGPAFPFFSPVLGWLGVVLTGSVTSACALFGNLQVVTANTLGLSPILTASANAAGGVMGKMISLQSIAVAVAATGMARSDEAKLFRVMVRHSLVLVSIVGVLALIYAYALPSLIPRG